jgi:hypothetical protein
VAGAALCWLVVARLDRRDDEISDGETLAEATWLSRTLTDEGHEIDPALVEVVLRGHRRYLGLPRPDVFVAADAFEPARTGEAETDDGAVTWWPDEQIGDPGAGEAVTSPLPAEAERVDAPSAGAVPKDDVVEHDRPSRPAADELRPPERQPATRPTWSATEPRPSPRQ